MPTMIMIHFTLEAELLLPLILTLSSEIDEFFIFFPMNLSILCSPNRDHYTYNLFKNKYCVLIALVPRHLQLSAIIFGDCTALFDQRQHFIFKIEYFVGITRTNLS